MTQRKPVPPKKKPPTTQYLSKPMDELHPNELWRVRDKDWEVLHGENLSHADALKLKDRVVATGKSRTARVEMMSVPPPDWYVKQAAEIAAENGEPAAGVANGNAPDPMRDPQLEVMREPARRAAAKAAADANQRHQAKAAAKDRTSPQAAKRVAGARTPLPPVPVVSTVLAEDDDLEIDDNVDPADVGSIVSSSGSDKVTAEDAKRMRERQGEVAQVKLPANTPELQAKAKALYQAEIERKGGGMPFEKLHPQVQAHWRLEATKPPVPPPAPEEEAPPEEPAGDGNGEPDVTTDPADNLGKAILDSAVDDDAPATPAPVNPT